MALLLDDLLEPTFLDEFAPRGLSETDDVLSAGAGAESRGVDLARA